MDGSHWCVLFDEDWVLELPPPSALGAVFGGDRAWMPLHDNGLVIHPGIGDAYVEEGDENVERGSEQTFRPSAKNVIEFFDNVLT